MTTAVIVGGHRELHAGSRGEQGCVVADGEFGVARGPGEVAPDQVEFGGHRRRRRAADHELTADAVGRAFGRCVTLPKLARIGCRSARFAGLAAPA